MADAETKSFLYVGTTNPPSLLEIGPSKILEDGGIAIAEIFSGPIVAARYSDVGGANGNVASPLREGP